MANFAPVINLVQTSYTVKDLLYRSYRMARALRHPGQGLSVPSESDEGLAILNAMIDGWKIEQLMVEYIRRTLQPVTLNQKVYSVGPGQDWDIERPEKILGAGFIVKGTPPNGDAELPMQMLFSWEEYQSFVVKDVQSTYPLALYYQAAVPFGSATLWPVPNDSGQNIAIYTNQLLQEFQTIDDPLILKDGYREALEYNLAVAIHEVYPEKVISPTIITKADWYKQRVKNNNFQPMLIKSDEGARQNAPLDTWFGGLPKAWTPYTG